MGYAHKAYIATGGDSFLKKSELQDGAGHEDEVDHIYGWHRADVGVFTGVTLTHFWDADRGQYAQSSLGALDDLFNGGDKFPNGWQKVEQYWSMALGEYAKGDIGRANHFLGHIAHHVGDNTIPTHAHVSAHDPVSGDDSYEDWMSRGGQAHDFPYQPPGYRLDGDEQDDLNEPVGMYSPKADGHDPLEYIALNKDIPEMSGDETPLKKLYWLLYTTNQIADFFASDRVDGDITDPEKWVETELDYLKERVTFPRKEEHLENNDCRDFLGGNGVACIAGGIDDYDNDLDGDLSTIRTYSYLRGIRAIAAVFKLFEETVKTQAIASLVIERVQELDGCDPAFNEDCDFYAVVAIDSETAKNEGDRFLNAGSDNATDISPDWAWGQAVGSSGTIPIQIMILDEDIGNDGLVNITAKELNLDGCPITSPCVIDRILAAYTVNLSLDLAKCMSREDGAITGNSFTGGSRCGKSLKTDPTGDEDDDAQGIAKVTFVVDINDVIPPVIMCGSADGLWHDDDVQIFCEWKDEFDGSNGSFWLSTNVPPGTEMDNAVTGKQTVCDDSGNCAMAGPIDGNKVDKKAPVVSVVQPTATEYVHSATLTLDYSVTDGGSGVDTVTPTINGSSTLEGHDLLSGQAINLLTELPLGAHTFEIDAFDDVGNVSPTASVTFTIIVTPQSIIDAVNQFAASGAVGGKTVRSLLAKLGNAQRKWGQGKCGPAVNMYKAFINEVRAKSGKSISLEAAEILIADAEYLRANCSD